MKKAGHLQHGCICRGPTLCPISTLCLGSTPFLPYSLLPIYKVNSFPMCSQYSNQPKHMGSDNHELNTLKLWTQINLFSLRLFFGISQSLLSRSTKYRQHKGTYKHIDGRSTSTKQKWWKLCQAAFLTVSVVPQMWGQQWGNDWVDTGRSGLQGKRLLQEACHNKQTL